jgi:tetratricopeptide (TPR) repeat protein
MVGTQLRCLVIALSMLWSASAVAQPTAAKRAQAEAAYKEGLRHYNVGDYPRAIEKFKESYLLFPAPLLLFNVAQAHRLNGDCEQALRQYRAYLREEPKPANKKKVDEAIKICEEKLAALPPEPLIAAPVEEQPVAASEPVPAPVEEQPVAAPMVVDQGNPGRGKRLVGLTLVGVGVAAAVTGIYFGLEASSSGGEIEDFRGTWDQSWEDREARHRRNATLAPIFLGAGAAAMTGGVVLYLVGRRQARVSAAPTDGGLAFALSGRF